MISSITEGTLQQYSACYKKYWNYCKNVKVKFFSYNLENYLNFLTEESQKETHSYSSINTYRSALNLIFPITKTDEILIKRFIKGIFNISPPQPKYPITWNPEPLLNYLATLHPLESLSMDKLTLKMVTLMALASAHRVQTLSKVTVNNIIKNPGKIEIKISDRIKTSGPNRLQPILVFPYFQAKPELCVASSIEFYVEKTSNIRGSINNLILTYKRPFHPASTQTISRWIKTAIKNSGININKFSSHSVRHASTSAALRCGLNINTIKNTAGWSQGSEVFLKFYNRPVGQPNEIFANTILSLGIEKTNNK